MSKPAQQGKMFSMIVSSTPAPEDIESVKQSAPRALAEARRQLGVRSDVQARLFSGLEAPSDAGLRPAQAEWIITRSQAHFHASWVSRSDMRNSFRVEIRRMALVGIVLSQQHCSGSSIRCTVS